MASLNFRHQEEDAFIKEIFSSGYVFPQQDTDDDFEVEIDDLVSFGDIKDASCTEPQNAEVDGTIVGHICTVRKFFPGKYKVTVVNLIDSERYGCNDPLVIFHHEDIDPNLLALQVIHLDDDYCVFRRGLRNYINRYDWCHWTHFSGEGGDYEKATDTVVSVLNEKFKSTLPSKVTIPDLLSEHFRTLIYFTRNEDAKNLTAYIQKGHVHRSSVIKHLFSVKDDNGKTISLGINFTPFNSGEWEYGKVFEDPEIGCNYALILNGYLSLDEGPWKKLYTSDERSDMGFTTIHETGLKFPMSQFKLKK